MGLDQLHENQGKIRNASCETAGKRGHALRNELTPHGKGPSLRVQTSLPWRVFPRREPTAHLKKGLFQEHRASGGVIGRLWTRWVCGLQPAARTEVDMDSLILVQLTTEEREALGRLPAIEALMNKLAARQANVGPVLPLHRQNLLSPREVGKVCGCNAETVRRAIVMGLLPAITLQRARGGRQGLLIAREAAAEWLARGRPVR